jgi:hypothetical protein
MVKQKQIIILNYGYSGYESITHSEHRESINAMKDAIKDLGLKVINKSSKTFGEGKLKIFISKDKKIDKNDLIKQLKEYPANDNGDPVTDWYVIK